jgi:hypothetical protein
MLCRICMPMIILPIAGLCGSCSNETASLSYEYCEVCARGRCQMCGNLLTDEEIAMNQTDLPGNLDE